MNQLRPFSEITGADLEHVGGKGLSLGLMAAAGLPVPPGFCITTSAYRQAGGALQPPLADALNEAYRALGGGPVAVRSSATAEDGAAASFAGQQETILGVEGEPALKDAVERCWRSLHSERAKAYRQKQGIDDAGLAMAVVVQRLVPAEVAGVLFTRDPHDPAGAHMLIEASWGLGEAVVSGKVTPDAFQIARADGQVLQRRLGVKKLRITPKGEEAVTPEQQVQFCLSDPQLAELAELGQKVEAYYGEARDIEWAWAEGRFWLLQARPITTSSANDREKVRVDEIETLKRLADSRGTVWSRYNLIEVLPEPTPMTWAVVECLLSGNGGSGRMYRDFGLQPSPALDGCTVYDLIGGRPYCNLSREPLMQNQRAMLDYPFALYKNSPLLALAPTPDPKTMYRGIGRVLRLPGFLWRQVRFARRVGRQSLDFPDRFRRKVVHEFAADVKDALTINFSRFDLGALLQFFEHWVQRTLIDFARESLKPTLFAQFALQVLEQQLQKPLGPERTRAALAELSTGVHPDPDADFAQAMRSVVAGKLTKEDFLKRFGHRGPGEMELAQPRWAEDPAALERSLQALHPGDSQRDDAPSIGECWERIAAEAKLNSIVKKWLGGYVERLRTHLGLRETAKHHLMRGYALIRQALVEFDRHFRLQGGVFFLTPEELPGLIQGQDLVPVIQERQRYRRLALGLDVPPVVFSDDLEAIGRPRPAPAGARELHGTPLSAGVAEGPALVLDEPVAVASPEGYILVCPSTDPAWVPLFVNAKGLVMESGGALSHGAIVAREFGLPAVAGLPDVHRQLKTGQRLRVDGGRGIVTVLE
jgi:rifampicin phosphotransferase